jgi:hypothetical protein
VEASGEKPGNPRKLLEFPSFFLDAPRKSLGVSARMLGVSSKRLETPSRSGKKSGLFARISEQKAPASE